MSVTINLCFVSSAWAEKRFFSLNRDAVHSSNIFAKPANRTARNFIGLGRYKPLSRGKQKSVAYRIQPQRDNRRMDDLLAIGHAWPLPSGTEYRISSPFGHRIHPVTGDYGFHEGVDIAAEANTPVLATHDGVVTGVGTHARLGRYVKLQHHEQEYSLYGHLSEWMVNMGDEVRQGDMLGLVGSTGRSTGAHLDYSLRRDGKAVDPMDYLSPPDTVKALAFSQTTR